MNKTRVIPARLIAQKVPTGGRIEVLLLKKRDDLSWECLVGGKGLTVGKALKIIDGPKAIIAADLGGSRRLIEFDSPIEAELDRLGSMPLPPYIHTPLVDRQRYQTVYAESPGSAAAPTAGLHFTPQLIRNLNQKGVHFCEVTLHIGLDTFAPVSEELPEKHKIHTEWCQVDELAAASVNRAREEGRRIVAVGTTSVRALESAALKSSGQISLKSFEGPTDLYILPGYQFRAVDALITNFHLPKSTLIMLVSAFACWDQIRGLSISDSDWLPLLFLLDGQLTAEATVGVGGVGVLRRKLAVRLRAVLRASDVVASIGNDAFAVLLAWMDTPQAAAGVADKIQQALTRPVRVGQQDVAVAVGIGTAQYPGDGKEARVLLRQAFSAAVGASPIGRAGFSTHVERGTAEAANDPED